MGLRGRGRRRKRKRGWGDGRGRSSSRSSLYIYKFPPYLISHDKYEKEFSEKEKIPKGYQIPDIFDSKWRQGRPLEREDNVKRGLGHLERVAEQGNDQPTALNSNLGRIDYAHGLAALLLNHYIKVALVAGIFEFWGMGKSSIMIQDMVGNKFLALNMEEEAEVNNDLSASTSKKVSVMHKIKITIEDIRYLLPRAWLNDEVNLYLELLKERAKIGCTQFLKCHFFNAFFYTKARYIKDEAENKRRNFSEFGCLEIRMWEIFPYRKMALMVEYS
ncbi:uncharacterized protein LOC131061471 [Cryptomeria japonica]|uniref:uncharacterized protein LOC131061471 n=1 Tax=Cryptomeria japonica TaxID=3369 RepID=UPI0025AC1E56|nr:uncharacterized protein LOC131061471 [Cryptomeria japonica]